MAPRESEAESLSVDELMEVLADATGNDPEALEQAVEDFEIGPLSEAELVEIDE